MAGDWMRVRPDPLVRRMMSHAPILILLLAACAFFVPEAAACDLEDPTGTTTTCAEEGGYGSLECDAPDTSGYGFTYVETGVDGIVAVWFLGSAFCYEAGTSGTEAQYVEAGAETDAAGAHVYVSDYASHYNGNPAGSCYAGFVAEAPVVDAFGYYNECPWGLVPQPGWGSLLPP